MEAKEKAMELVNKLIWPQRKFNELAKHSVAIECALIAVEEIIDLLNHTPILNSAKSKETDKIWSYWVDVKHELEAIK